MDTIVALASGSLPSGIAIVRVSGGECRQILKKFLNKPITCGSLQLRNIIDPTDQSLIDQGMVYYTKMPNSFTGEDVVEFQLHGSKIVVRTFLERLGQLDNVRLALPGEFSKRAFENGRLDLSEVEGLSDLLLAETESQRVQAIARQHGELSELVSNWRALLIDLLADAEANLDFSDEDDVGHYAAKNAITKLQLLYDEIAINLSSYEYGRIVREGFRVGVAGLPNVGKSSIINALVKSDRLIVTDEAGTTRDIHEVQLDIEGQLFVIIDSAGIRKSESVAETIGVDRAVDMMNSADLVLWVSAPDVENSHKMVEFTAPFLGVENKSDLVNSRKSGVQVCAKNGDVDALKTTLLQHVTQLKGSSDSILFSRERDRQALKSGLVGISKAIELLKEDESELSLELVVESLRVSVISFERLLGKVDAEDILDRLFEGFCIGK